MVTGNWPQVIPYNMVKLVFAAALSVFLFCQVPPISHWIEDLVDDFDTMCSYEYAAADAYNAFVHKHRVAAYAAGVRVHRYRAPWYCAVSRPVPVVHPLGWLMSQYETTTGYVGELLERLDVANVTLADGLRVMAETAFTAYTYYQIIWFQLVFIVLLTGFFLALVCSSRVRVIRVRNRVRGYSVTDLVLISRLLPLTLWPLYLVVTLASVFSAALSSPGVSINCLVTFAVFVSSLRLRTDGLN